MIFNNNFNTNFQCKKIILLIVLYGYNSANIVSYDANICIAKEETLV